MSIRTEQQADAATSRTEVPRGSQVASGTIAVGIVTASLYGLLADDPYRGLPHETVVAAHAQDACSVVVAVLLLALARRTSPRAHLVRLGLLAYVAYSYAIYVTGLPMNRLFLVYLLLLSLSAGAFLHGLLRLRPSAWPRVASRALERGTGGMLLAVALLFGALWLSTLLPFAFGGSSPSPAGPGGVAYPVFVLDLGVALPALAVVGVLLLQGKRIAGPLTAVVLVKVVTLFTALWAGVVVELVQDGRVSLAADAGPSLALLLVSVALATRWLRTLAPDPHDYVRPRVWVS